MSGSGRLNDLDSGGSGNVKKGMRPDLQEKMKRRFGQNNRSSVSNSENTSPIPFDEQVAGPDGASRRSKAGAAVASGRERREQGGIDEALASVLDELDRTEKSKRQHSSKEESTAMFQNNLDDPEPTTPLNIPPGGVNEEKLGAFGKHDKKKDVLRNMKQTGSFKQDENLVDESNNNGQTRTNSQDALQQMLDSLISDFQNGNDSGDALSATFGGRLDSSSLSEEMFGLMADRNDDSERQQTEKKTSEGSLKGLVADGGRIPVMGSMGKRRIVGGAYNDRRKAEGEQSKTKTPEEKADEDINEEMSGKRTEPGEDSVAVMLKNLTKDTRSMSDLFPGMDARKGQGGVKAERSENGKPSSFVAPRSFERGRIGGMFQNERSHEALKGRGSSRMYPSTTTSGDTGVFPEHTGGRNRNPLPSMLGGLGRGSMDAEDNNNSFRDLVGMLGGRGGNGDRMQQTLGSLMGGLGSDGERGGRGLNDFAATLLGGGSGGQSESGDQLSDMLSSLMSGAGRGGVGGFPSAMMGRGDGRGGSGDQMTQTLSALMSGAGRGGIGGFPSAMMGRGDGRGGSGDQMAQTLNSLMGGAGRGFASAMMGRGGGQGGSGIQMPQALSNMMSGERGNQKVPTMSGFEDLDPDKANENDVIQQLLGYEMIKAQSNRAPRADQALHTIIIVDTSGSMDGEPLIEAGRFISQFIHGLEELQFEYNLQENVALISVGGETQVVQHFTNDYSLVRRATDTLCASGSSRLHMGLILPTSLLSNGSTETGFLGRIYHIGNHIACPRIIFISDGHVNVADDIPGQVPNPDDQALQAFQTLCLELTQKMTESTLSKIYCVPVGSANVNFLEMLSQCCGGKLIQPTGAKHMSRCLLHHVLVSKLNESGKQTPTRDEVAEILKQITATAEEDDINGVFEVIGEGEPDVEARNLRVSQEMMQSIQGRGRGGNRGAMPALNNIEGPVPGGQQSFPGRGRGREWPGGLPGEDGTESIPGISGLPEMLRMPGGRGRPGGLPGRDGTGGIPGISGLPEMLRMPGGRGRPGGLPGRDGTGGIPGISGLPEMLRMPGGRGRPGSLPGEGSTGGIPSINGLPEMLRMPGGRGRARGADDLNGFGGGTDVFKRMMRMRTGRGMDGDGAGGGGEFRRIREGGGIAGGNGTDNLISLNGLMGKVGKSEIDKTSKGDADDDKRTPIAMESSGQERRGQSNLETLLGKPHGLGFGEKKVRFRRENVLSGGEKRGQSAQVNKDDLGLIDNPSEVVEKKVDTDEHKESRLDAYERGQKQNGSLQNAGGQYGKSENEELGLFNSPVASGKSVPRMKSAEERRQVNRNESTRVQTHNDRQRLGLGICRTNAEKTPDGDSLGQVHDSSDQSMLGGDNSVGTNGRSGSNEPPFMLGLEGAGAKEPLLGLIKGNKSKTKIFERGKLNTVPPCSFGVDDSGNAYDFDLMDDNESDEGDELMEKIGEWLGIDIEENDGDASNVPEMFGLRAGQEGLNGVPPDIEAFFQNLRTDSRMQNEDGDVIMRDEDPGIGLQGDPDERNLQNFGRGNTEQPQASLPRGFGLPAGGPPNLRLQQFQQLWQNSQGGNQGMAHLAERLGQLNMNRHGERDDNDNGNPGFFG